MDRLTLAEVGAMMRCGRSTLTRLVNEGVFPATERVHGKWYILGSRADIANVVRQHIRLRAPKLEPRPSNGNGHRDRLMQPIQPMLAPELPAEAPATPKRSLLEPLAQWARIAPETRDVLIALAEQHSHAELLLL